MTIFETVIPYQIADKITNCHELSPDLVAHVYLLMLERNDIDDETKFFARCAYQQWTWYNSEFNKLYRPHFLIELNEEICTEEDEPIHNDKFRKHFREYLIQQPEDVYDWFRREIALMYLDGMNYRQIQAATRINLRYISQTINQFKDDVYNSFYSDSDSNDSDNVQLDA